MSFEIKGNEISTKKLKDDENDKINCFARISKESCNALNEKKCKNCSFYKHKNQVPDYKKYLEIK